MTASGSDEIVIEINQLTKDYQVGFLKKKTVRALDSLSLEVRRGEIFAFLGPNGAGKTTTLKLLMRLIYPTSGSARILGQPIDDVATRARIGYLPENPYFYDYLSGHELLEYTAALFGIPKPQAKARASELLQLVGLEEERANRQLRKYSKGMLQRIGIAQALVNDPEVIFLDEPMSGLDPIGRREVRDLMLSLRRQNKTIFFSSHILSDVETLCDRAAILKRGRLVRSGTIQELTAHEGAVVEV
ncbi:MAG TPA: ABC transporter ATP-binding protein, partial [Blastocatellia bacterium]|nr:ABC transporter ATP-binding protein [Blastocatellia bacterium]